MALLNTTYIQEGSYTMPAAAAPVTLPLDPNQIAGASLQSIYIENYTQIAGQGAGILTASWNVGMPNGTAFSTTVAAPQQMLLASPNGFLVTNVVANPVVTTTTAAAGSVTAITNGAGPGPITVTQNGHGYQTGYIVRLVSTLGGLELDGIDWSVTRTGANTYTLTYANQAIATAAAPGAAATATLVSAEPFYIPNNRVISDIRVAAGVTSVLFAAPHQFTVGQIFRFDNFFSNGPGFQGTGMVQLNGVQATVLSVTDANTVTVDTNVSAFGAFTFPNNAAVPFTPPQATPIGENTAVAIANAVNVLGDAVLNSLANDVSIVLPNGAGAVGGIAADVVYWQVVFNAINF